MAKTEFFMKVWDDVLKKEIKLNSIQCEIMAQLDFAIKNCEDVVALPHTYDLKLPNLLKMRWTIKKLKETRETVMRYWDNGDV